MESEKGPSQCDAHLEVVWEGEVSIVARKEQHSGDHQGSSGWAGASDHSLSVCPRPL